MSELKIENLKKMSAKNLEELISTLDGENKILAEKVLASKFSARNIKNDPIVKDAIEKSKEMSKDKRAREAEREAIRKQKEEAAKKLAEEKARKEKEKEAERKKILAIKEEQRINREKKKEEILARKKEREQARIEKQKKRAELIAEKERIVKEKEKARQERAKLVAERLREYEANNVKPKTKTDAVRELVLQGLTNPEIAKATGYGIKFVCDTVWRLERMAEKYAQREKEAKEAVEKKIEK